jgi:kynurenine formamidase
MLSSGFGLLMKLIDVTVPLDAPLPTYSNNTPLTLEPNKGLVHGDSSNVSSLHLSAHAGTHVEAPRQVGVDYLSVEEVKKPGAPAHRLLLGGGTIVIEGLNRREVEPGIYDMYCLPLRVVGSDGAPARVVLRKS